MEEKLKLSILKIHSKFKISTLYSQRENQGRLNTIHIAIIGGFIFIAYMLYALTVSIYRNYQIQIVIEKFEKENQQLEEENQQKLANYQYYISEKYVDKIAKLHLGLINPGEEVIVIPEAIDLSELLLEEEQLKKEAKLAKLSPVKRWFNFIFKQNMWKE